MGLSRHFVQLLSVSATALAVTSEEASLIAWKAYGDLIRQYITSNAPLTPGVDFIYVTPPTSQFVRGGTPVPESVTNFELFGAVDPLQNVNSPLLGTTGASYVQSLETYLQSVAISDRVLTEPEKTKVDALEAAVTAARIKFQKEKATAFLTWKSDEVAQYFNQSFQSWIGDNDPNYANFQTQLTNADATYNNYMLSLYGSKYNLLQEQRTNINSKAQNELAPVPGYNMMVYPAAPNYAVSITPFQKNEITDFIAYKATYTMGGYEDVCDRYYKGTAASTSLTYNFKSVNGNDWSTLGYSQQIKKAGGGFWGILGFKASKTAETTEYNSWSGNWASEVSINLKMRGAPTLVPINAGFWDVGNVRKTYPKLRAGETDDLAGTVRLTHALVGYGLSLEIKFSNTETWRNVTQFIQKGKGSAGAGINLFGFSFGAGGSGSYSYNFNDLKTSNTADGGVITFPSTPDGMVFMLGARGKAL
ncbi:hypothetical protein P154DRAFT_119796 [Amniculicola lignicola CBS 123094]|uniref:Uncharacterized protein n=1 Tax=Amniculicola lignicola CBS 123094 TaxID=1392246 RepID=A0A6A5X3J5_9PLEO|nr:hypothetical protein P154DRAFT_119796 [Amniculicola lignicola CBS 123094]